MELRICRYCATETVMARWTHACKECSEERSYQLDLKERRCDSKARDHSRWTCKDCAAIKRANQKEAARRGAATRRRNNPNWARPTNCERQWQYRAHTLVAQAKRLGILPILDGTYACTDCGGVATEYDHRDYARPLDVEPVCAGCNKRRGTAKWPSPGDFSFKRLPQSEASNG